MIAAIVMALILLLWAVMYNTLIDRRSKVEQIFAGLEALLRKRYDLVSDLVAAAQQHMQYEAGLLTELSELYARAVSGQVLNDEIVALNDQISRALGGIMVAVENYPDLKAQENFLKLRQDLQDVEQQLSPIRHAYNTVVMDYNDVVETWPTNVMARMMHYKRNAVFEIPEIESLGG